MQVSPRISARVYFSAFRARRPSALFLLFLLALFPVLGIGGGCKKAGGAGERPLLEVAVRDRTGAVPDPALKIDPDKIRTDAVQELERIGFKLREAKAEEIPWQAELVIELTAERSARPDDAGVVSKDQSFRAVAVSVRLWALKASEKTGVRPEYGAQAIAARNVGLFDGIGGLEREAVVDAVRLIGVDLDLENGADAQVMKRLEDADLRIRMRAVSGARERKLKTALPGLVAILNDEAMPTELVMEAIGALIAIGDAAAVNPLIEAGRRRSPLFLAQILFGLAQIGGREAEAYLFTVSSGHPDPEVRQNADEALRELERRKARTAGKNKGG